MLASAEALRSIASVLKRLRGWVAGGGTADIAAAINLDRRQTAAGEEHHVTINHLLPEPGRGSDWRFRVTTSHQMLPNAHFDRAVRARVNQASRERGRRIYAIERNSLEVMAALSYHLDASTKPEVIATLTRLGFRNAPRLKGFTPSGRHLRQDPVNQR